jgi:formyltetrahydrofolate-dependent phosphoribosylglycinamide formyltransferase
LKRVAVLISGRGSNLGSLIDAQDDSYKIIHVMANIAGAGGLERAAAAGIATTVIPHAGKSREAFDAEIDAALRGANAEIVVLAGFMRILSDGFVRGWEGRLVNIHPSLLPAYKGTKVHERVIAAKETTSGASVHFVVPELDAGPVIAQASVPVHPSDTPGDLAARVLAVELKLYPEALKLLASGKVALKNGLAIFA